jgi:hypothetical protein
VIVDRDLLRALGSVDEILALKLDRTVSEMPRNRSQALKSVLRFLKALQVGLHI